MHDLVMAQKQRMNRSSPRASFVAVDDSISVNMIVTVPSGEDIGSNDGRSSSISEAISSIDVVTTWPNASTLSTPIDRCQWTAFHSLCS